MSRSGKEVFIDRVAGEFFDRAQALVERGLVQPRHSILVRTFAGRFWDNWKAGYDVANWEARSIWDYAQMGINGREPLPGDETDDGRNTLIEAVEEAGRGKYPGQSLFLVGPGGYYGDTAQEAPSIHGICVAVAGLTYPPRMEDDPAYQARSGSSAELNDLPF